MVLERRMCHMINNSHLTHSVTEPNERCLFITLHLENVRSDEKKVAIIVRKIKMLIGGGVAIIHAGEAKASGRPYSNLPVANMGFQESWEGGGLLSGSVMIKKKSNIFYTGRQKIRIRY